MSEATDKIKNRIIKKIKLLSPEKLKTLDDYISQLEIEQNLKEEILDYAGSFQDLGGSFLKI